MFAKGQFYLRPEDISAQQEFLSYPRGRHDDIMDAIWTALDGSKPCRLIEMPDKDDKIGIRDNFLDWMTQ